MMRTGQLRDGDEVKDGMPEQTFGSGLLVTAG